jgi:succinoglycan biosynthesis protein ExoV
MDLIYYKDPHGNFGDDLNEWIWDHLLPGWQTCDQSTSLMGVGTLLNKKRLDPLRDRKLLIVGSGVGYGSVPALPPPAGWDVCRPVRGQQSARLLSLHETTSLLDPAIMILDFAEYSAIKTAGPPIFIPNHKILAGSTGQPPA